MKLFTFPLAPNGKRVEMFIAEKAISDVSVEYIEMGPAGIEQIRPLNPMAQVPVLEVEKGVGLSESTTICRYLEDLYPTPCLMGESVLQRAHIDMWQRRVELGLFIPAVEFGHHTHPYFKNHFKQISVFGPHFQSKAEKTIAVISSALQQSDYIAGNEFSIVDITAFCALQLGTMFQLHSFDTPSFKDWSARVNSRSSARLAKYPTDPT